MKQQGAEMSKFVAKKGEKVILHGCTHDLGSDISEEYICETDMTDDDLMDLAREFVEGQKELEWWWTKADES